VNGKRVTFADLEELSRQPREPISPTHTESHPVSESLSDKESHPKNTHLAFPKERHPVSESLSDTETPSGNLNDLAYQIDYRKGNLRINLDYLDNVISKLTRNARLLYIYLLRYREGSSNFTIRLNWPMLEDRTDISRSVLHKAARELNVAGLAFVVEREFGKGKEQGFRFRLSHTASHTVDGSHAVSESHAVSADSNRKALITNSNRLVASLDVSKCPDCKGAGFYYPHGFDKGVVKCKHKNLAEEK
jgi:hypothetical protein